MADGRWSVEGRNFNTKREYEAALRDLSRVEQLRKTADFHSAQSIMDLHDRMQMRNIRFETVVGRDFVEEIDELAHKIRRGEFKDSMAASGEKNSRRKSGDGIRFAGKRSANGSGSGNASEDTGTANKSAGRGRRTRVKVYTKREYRLHIFLRVLVLAAAIGCLGYFGYYSHMMIKTRNEAKQLASLKENDTLNAMMKSEVVVHKDTPEERVYELLDEYKTLYNKNKNLIGWLKIDDTNIDYPVMQTSDNEYYLDHNINQEYDKNGTLFLDKDCDIYTPSTNFIIYGHHMKSGQMFGNLKKYKSESYFKKHRYIQFDTIYERGSYEVMYVFNSKIYYEDEITFKYYQFIDAFSEQEFDSNMQEMAKLSLYDTGVSAQYGDQLLTLSTCDYGENDARFVVVAKRVL